MAKKEEESETDSLGMDVSKNDYTFKANKSAKEKLTDFVKGNPTLSFVLAYLFLIFLYGLLIFNSLTAYHYMAYIVSGVLMLWVASVDDARILLKLGSVTAMFLLTLVFFILQG
ncbi:MAG: hypothetical protein ACQEP1_03665 [Nanobdellota archaeon]